MNRVVQHNLAYYRFNSLDHPSLVQAVFTRLGGASSAPFDSLNVGLAVGDEPTAIEQNSSLIYKALGIQANQVVTSHQAHGVNVSRVDNNAGGTVIADTDAMVTDRAGVYLLMRFADCVPILLWDPIHSAVALVHAGWQGTLKQIIKAAVDRMVTEYNTQPDVLRAGIGPAIGPCCYQVGPEVVAKVHETLPDAPGILSQHTANGQAYLDLWTANRSQLERCGVRQIEIAGKCTCCHQDEFYSHRGSGGLSGRFAVLVGLR